MRPELKLLKRQRKSKYKPRSKTPPTKCLFNGIEHLKARTKNIPFGYKISETYDGWLEPIPIELEALSRAFKLIKSNCTYHDVAEWLYQVTNRKISAQGLHKALRRGY